MKKQNRLLAILTVVLVMVFLLSTMGRPARAESLKAPKTKTPTPTGPTPTPGVTTIGNIIPMPVSITSTGGSFVLPSTADIYVEPGTAELTAIGQYLAEQIKSFNRLWDSSLNDNRRARQRKHLSNHGGG